MDQQYNFDGRVAVVTGAGRGIGRAHALLLGKLGACVVVNDLGGTMEGVGADAGPAHDVASEITAAGGRAIANGNDVSTVDGGQAIIDAAVNEFGRIDIIVNNAGIVRWAGLPECDADNMNANHAVHVMGSFNTTRAAWPHMVEQGYGRIVMTTSTGMFGLLDNLAYATAKAAVVGMARSLTVNGAPHGIKINLIAPAAYTRMAGGMSDTGTMPAEVPQTMTPEFVAPMVAFLASEACTVSGEIYAAGANHFTRIFTAETPGYVHTSEGVPTIDDVGRNWSAINDETGYYVPRDLLDWSAHFMAHR